MFYFTILLIISNILWENIDTILLLLCTTIYKIFISFCAPTIFECFIFFPFGNVGGSHMLWLFGLESGGREFGRHSKWVSGGCKWAARHHRHRHATSLSLSSLRPTNGNIGFHSSRNYFVIMDRTGQEEPAVKKTMKNISTKR